ncbi:MAG: FtsW/RodA/SpoVE family cell cycle protein [Nocardioidaceae bacterium]|nr:FtsW/RodA/SpoVE family cell cycle protein [Nocardioidaceae bacterium]MCL2614280.1 FtsW/RodA/SpoVE family cell cycle protein [Nocardioidaceae bacterium]
MAASPLMGFVHRRRRGAELFLLVIALLVGLGAYLAVGLGVDGAVPTNLATYGSWLAALIIAAHVTVRLVAPYADPVLLPIVAALNGLGLALIHRIDLAVNSSNASKQLMWMTLGVALFIATLFLIRDHRVLGRYTYTFGLGAIVLLALPMLPVIGTEVNGSRIWVHLGPLSLQPGELAKVLLVLAFAGYLVGHRDALALAGRRVLFIDLPRGRDLGPILAMWVISMCILVVQKDLGSSLLFFGIFLVMLYVATERSGWLYVGAAMFLAGALAAYKLVAHVTERVDIWLHPFQDANGTGYQLVQGIYSFSWGGLLGRGLGQGMITLGSGSDVQLRVPEEHTDFILALVGEELGLTGVIAVLLLYGLIVERALRAALIARDGFGKLVAAGLGCVLAIQVFVVIGGVTRLIPLTGLTTPFLSYGGSSLIANWVIVALLLRISDQARRPMPDLTETEAPDEQETQIVKVVSD